MGFPLCWLVLACRNPVNVVAAGLKKCEAAPSGDPDMPGKHDLPTPGQFTRRLAGRGAEELAEPSTPHPA